MRSSDTLFRLGDDPAASGLATVMNSIAGRALALERLGRFYASLGPCADAAEFSARALDRLGVQFAVDAASIERISAHGPAIVVANHPYGGLEGLFLLNLLLQRRRDVRVLANDVLQRIPELRELFIPVDVFGGADAVGKNMRGLRAALRHVRDGGLLTMFPAGAVSHLQLDAGQVLDPPWSPTAARLIRRCECDVTPVHFSGGNSLVFQAAGLLHPLLRTALLPRELFNKRHRPVQVRIGSPIEAAGIAAKSDDASLAGMLRLATYSLADAQGRPSLAVRAPAGRDKPHAALAEAVPAALVAAELESLPASQRLTSAGDLQVLYATAQQLPWTLQEIGRLRELTFRAVGEGTGRAADLDVFDNYYVHLIAWNPRQREIVGCYRVGHTDEIVMRHGLRGLYTHTLFHYNRGLIGRLGPALELGRSFVRPEYQRSFAGLLQLWRGIAEYVIRHPRYRVLFGPVSISNDYCAASRNLLVEYLRRQCREPSLARLIRARQPFRRHHPLASLGSDLAQLRDLDDLSLLLSGLERDGKGVPILLRQYLKLGGRLLGFNVDENFGHSIDALIMVDLPRVEAKTLQRYMGREGAATYLAHQATLAQGERRRA